MFFLRIGLPITTGLFVPPIFLIASVIKYMIACKGQGTLIGPCWPSAPFWPLLYKTKYQRYSYVKYILFIEHPNEFLNVGNYKGSLLGHQSSKAVFLPLV